MRKKLTSLVVLSTFLVLLAISPGWAAVGVAIDSYYLEVPAGEVRNFHFTLSNTGQEPARAKIYLSDFRKDLQGSTKYLSAGSTARSLTDWLELKCPSMVELEADEVRQVEFSVTVPEDSEGTRWVSIVVENAPEFSQKEGVVSVFTKARYVIDVYQTVPGSEINEGKVTAIRAELTQGEFPLKTSIIFENTGNSLLKTKAWMEIRDLEQGDTVAKKIMKDISVLPGEKREMRASFDDQLAKGDYLLLGVVDYGGDDLVAGQTTFRLQ